MSEGPIRLVCLRASAHQAYVPGSVLKACAMCGENVWVSPESLRIGADMEFVCSVCAPFAMEITGDHPIMPPTKGQMDEVRRYLQ